MARGKKARGRGRGRGGAVAVRSGSASPPPGPPQESPTPVPSPYEGQGERGQDVAPSPSSLFSASMNSELSSANAGDAPQSVDRPRPRPRPRPVLPSSATKIPDAPVPSRTPSPPPRPIAEEQRRRAPLTCLQKAQPSTSTSSESVSIYASLLERASSALEKIRDFGRAVPVRGPSPDVFTSGGSQSHGQDNEPDLSKTVSISRAASQSMRDSPLSSTATGRRSETTALVRPPVDGIEAYPFTTPEMVPTKPVWVQCSRQNPDAGPDDIFPNPTHQMSHRPVELKPMKEYYKGMKFEWYMNFFSWWNEEEGRWYRMPVGFHPDDWNWSSGGLRRVRDAYVENSVRCWRRRGEEGAPPCAADFIQVPYPDMTDSDATPPTSPRLTPAARRPPPTSTSASPRRPASHRTSTRKTQRPMAGPSPAVSASGRAIRSTRSVLPSRFSDFRHVDDARSGSEGDDDDDEYDDEDEEDHGDASASESEMDVDEEEPFISRPSKRKRVGPDGDRGGQACKKHRPSAASLSNAERDMTPPPPSQPKFNLFPSDEEDEDSGGEDDEETPRRPLNRGHAASQRVPTSDEGEIELTPPPVLDKGKGRARYGDLGDEDENEDTPRRHPSRDKGKGRAPPPHDDLDDEGEEEDIPRRDKGKGRAPPPHDDLDDEGEEEDIPRRDKGKGRASPPPEDEDDEDEDTPRRHPSRDKGKGRAPLPPADEDDENHMPSYSSSPRSLPAFNPELLKAMKYSEDEIEELRTVYDALMGGCAKLNKSVQVILRALGLTIAFSKSPNSFNLFEAWLKWQPDTPSFEGRQEFVEYASNEYNKLDFKNLSQEEKDVLTDQWQIETLVHLEKTGKGGDAQANAEMPAVQVMNKVGRQLKDLCDAMHRTTSVDLICIVLSRDWVARQCSTIYTSSDKIRGIVERHQLHMRNMLDRLNNSLGAMESGILRPDAISLQDILVSAVEDVSQMAGIERDKQAPPPYTSVALPPRARIASQTRASVPPRPSTAPETHASLDPHPSAVPETQPDSPPCNPELRTITRREVLDYRVLVKTFPEGDFWAKKHTESNKDFHRRVCRFKFQADFCVLVDVAAFTNFWKRFSELMVRYRVVLRDWPVDIPAPGTVNFQINRLAADFVADNYRGWRWGTNINTVPWFDRWSQEDRQRPPRDPLYLDTVTCMGITEQGEEVALLFARDSLAVVHGVAEEVVVRDENTDDPPLQRARDRRAAVESFVEEVRGANAIHANHNPRARSTAPASNTATTSNAAASQSSRTNALTSNAASSHTAPNPGTSSSRTSSNLNTMPRTSSNHGVPSSRTSSNPGVSSSRTSSNTVTSSSCTAASTSASNAVASSSRTSSSNAVASSSRTPSTSNAVASSSRTSSDLANVSGRIDRSALRNLASAVGFVSPVTLTENVVLPLARTPVNVVATPQPATGTLTIPVGIVDQGPEGGRAPLPHVLGRAPPPRVLGRAPRAVIVTAATGVDDPTRATILTALTATVVLAVATIESKFVLCSSTDVALSYPSTQKYY